MDNSNDLFLRGFFSLMKKYLKCEQYYEEYYLFFIIDSH